MADNSDIFYLFSEKIAAFFLAFWLAYQLRFAGIIYIIHQNKKEVIMLIVKRNGRMLNQLPTMFDDFLNRDIFNWNTSNFSNTNTTIPAINVKETADHYEVEVAAPGMSKKDFKVQLEGNVLTISSEKNVDNEQQETEKENARYSLREFSYESFTRTFTLQKDVVDTDNIAARYEDGVLHLSIPKKETAKQKQPRMIEIS